eukprot:COSAG04_NODE_4079_length_2320_cov_1.355696_3_plen_184_part_00
MLHSAGIHHGSAIRFVSSTATVARLAIFNAVADATVAANRLSPPTSSRIGPPSRAPRGPAATVTTPAATVHTPTTRCRRTSRARARRAWGSPWSGTRRASPRSLLGSGLHCSKSASNNRADRTPSRLWMTGRRTKTTCLRAGRSDGMELCVHSGLFATASTLASSSSAFSGSMNPLTLAASQS